MHDDLDAALTALSFKPLPDRPRPAAGRPRASLVEERSNRVVFELDVSLASAVCPEVLCDSESQPDALGRGLEGGQRFTLP